MATIALYAGKMNQMSSLLEGAKKSVSDYQTELFSLKSKTLNVNKSVCDLDDVIRSVQSSTQLQEQKLDSLETLRQNVDNFIADVVRIDGDAAEVINRNKDEFYDKYNYLKPDCEKNLWEKICDGFAAAGEWCKEHWKFVVTIVLAVAAVVLICTGVGGPFAAIILGAAKGLLTGALIGGLMGGITSLAAGGSFFEGFEDGAFMGALTGALFGGIGGAGEALGALGKLGTTCEALGRLEKLAKISGTISFGMGTFDLLAWGAGLFAPDNAFTAFNQQLHSNSLYNAFQFGASALAVFSLGGIKGFYEKTPNPVCFVAGTMVLTASGLTVIENIRAGNKVISTNADTFETEEKTVLETYIRRTDKLIHLVIDGEEIITTETHPFYVKDRGFVDAGELLVGDPLIDVHGNVLLIEDIQIEYPEKPSTVYNFQVEDFHTYYVGTNCIFVHNADYNQSPKDIIAERTKHLDTQEHPSKYKQISEKEKVRLKAKCEDRTITKEEYKTLAWNKKMAKKRQDGVNKFWEQERMRLQRGENGTRNWTEQQKNSILNGGRPQYNGQTMQGHHSYSVSKYPHLADCGEVIFPTTRNEHLNGWHGGNYKNSMPGEPIFSIMDF